MARGFESKDVEFQQSEAERPKSLRPRLTPEERDAQARRQTLELALSRAQTELGLATFGRAPADARAGGRRAA